MNPATKAVTEHRAQNALVIHYQKVRDSISANLLRMIAGMEQMKEAAKSAFALFLYGK
jgi:hypothetical protein